MPLHTRLNIEVVTPCANKLTAAAKPALCNLSFLNCLQHKHGGYRTRKSVALAKIVRLKPLVLAYLIHSSVASGGEAGIETLCQELGGSTRTLQRKLQEEGTSYQELFEETQRDLSEFYLRKPEIAIGEVSYLLGFSQPSAFHRAFRRWTGLTPKEFRRLQKH